MEEIIRTESVTKRYREVTAVSDVSISVSKGEVYGFLGLNGAGKTTTIRMLLGMIAPTSGNIFIKGTAVRYDRTGLWKDIGYLVEIPYAYPDLTVRENLEIFRRLRGIDDRDAVRKVMDLLKLSTYAGRKARHLSLGNAQRLGLAKAMIHNPGILILDEPANGLDPAGIFEIRELLGDLAGNHGVTVFISSHILGEISRLATRIGIIHEGRLIHEISSSRLEQMARKFLLVSTPDNGRAEEFLQNQQIPCSTAKNGELVLTSDTYVEHPEKMAQLLVEHNLPPVKLCVEEEDLESYFLRIIGVN